MEQLKDMHENTLLISQLEIQEQTFEHIAREIHDNIGQKLTLAKLYLNTLSYSNREVTTDKIESSLLLITTAIEGLSDISRCMNTDLILENGLVKAMQFEVTKLEHSGQYTVEFLVDGHEVFLDTRTEVILFRAMQEATNNIIKYSGASQIGISLLYETGYLTMVISDNGKGFDQRKNMNGIGLVNIRKRAAMLKGSATIKSSEKGTIVMIKIPTNEKKIV